ncbi:hypothetical protein [Pseudobacteriovorax antillogorgiicola]|uniref:Phosphate-selective porin O and P n=1 Tax=Pseudobacteriovorax antillogorgiicola TaxID=1513793 RepID=A0A1Y6BX86_9BACT|nr:hypothetical protein [Pseudobacteriovorax antillogorgiicola]TCS53735.1 hypothetical protein EDD56_10744 [Pseudobacteriovorax antillogorgiicola]SMF22706.1 hypothetical protein SAMN06296036_107228 [Pseudobacteriovorax antillogorgiicola]
MSIPKILIFTLALIELRAFSSVKTKGRIKLGAKFSDTRDFESDGALKLEWDTKRRKGVEVIASVEGQYSEGEMALEDLYLNYEASEAQSVDLGITKMKFGYEYDLGSQKRLLLDRSYIYRKLEEFGYVGRSMQARYRVDSDSSRHTWSLGLTGTREALAIYNYNYRKNDWRFDSWSQIKQYRANRRSILAAVQNLGLRYKSSSHTVLELEGLIGVQPERTAYLNDTMEPERIYFSALKLAAGYSYDAFKPLASVSLYKDRLDKDEGYDLGYLLGFDYTWNDIILAAHLEYLEATIPTPAGSSISGLLNGQIEVRYYF